MLQLCVILFLFSFAVLPICDGYIYLPSYIMSYYTLNLLIKRKLVL